MFIVVLLNPCSCPAAAAASVIVVVVVQSYYISRLREENTGRNFRILLFSVP